MDHSLSAAPDFKPLRTSISAHFDGTNPGINCDLTAENLTAHHDVLRLVSNITAVSKGRSAHQHPDGL